MQNEENNNYYQENPQEPRQSEYRYSRTELPREEYVAAPAIPAHEEPNAPAPEVSRAAEDYRVPEGYRASPEAHHDAVEASRAEERTPKPKVRREFNVGFKQIVAMCLACALLGGGAGGLVGVTMTTGRGGSLPEITTTPDLSAAATTPRPLYPLSNSGSILSGAQIYDLGCPQVVGITTEVVAYNFFGQPTTMPVSGSGFILSSDGYIVTNYHVVEGATDIVVMLHNGETYNAEIVGVESETNDIAVLKIDAEGLSAAALGDSDAMRVGDTLYAIGNPLGELSYTMTSGMLSALDREIQTDARTKINMFQFDAAVNAGNSGGPVYNSQGEVVGIVTAKYSSTGVEGLGFAIPINDAAAIINELVEKGYVGKAGLDVTVETVTSSAARYYHMTEGSCIIKIEEGGAAALAGLRVGDIITKIGETKVASNAELSAALRQYSVGDTETLTIYRDGEYLEFPVTFSEVRPQTAPTQQYEQSQIPGIWR